MQWYTVIQSGTPKSGGVENGSLRNVSIRIKDSIIFGSHFTFKWGRCKKSRFGKPGGWITIANPKQEATQSEMWMVLSCVIWPLVLRLESNLGQSVSRVAVATLHATLHIANLRSRSHYAALSGLIEHEIAQEIARARTYLLHWTWLQCLQRGKQFCFRPGIPKTSGVNTGWAKMVAGEVWRGICLFNSVFICECLEAIPLQLSLVESSSKTVSMQSVQKRAWRSIIIYIHW